MLTLIIQVIGVLLILFGIANLLWKLLPQNKAEPTVLQQMQDIIDYIDKKNAEENKFQELLKNFGERINRIAKNE